MDSSSHAFLAAVGVGTGGAFKPMHPLLMRGADVYMSIPTSALLQITVDAWNRLQSVVQEVRRARNLRCSVCDKPGAALGCRVPSCPRAFHLPCAIEHGCW